MVISILSLELDWRFSALQLVICYLSEIYLKMLAEIPIHPNNVTIKKGTPQWVHQETLPGKGEKFTIVLNVLSLNVIFRFENSNFLRIFNVVRFGPFSAPFA